MKVVTLNREEFRRACQRLFLEITAAGLWPDVIVGIATGGEQVLNSLKENFPDAIPVVVKCSRPVSRNKKLLSPVLRYLPSRLNIWLRQIEARFVTRRASSGRTLQRPLDDSLAKRFQSPKVLILDDAVDSGNTLLTVANEVNRVWPDAKIRTAALTVTTENPVCHPDIALYKDLTLIRFPWSADTKTE